MKNLTPVVLAIAAAVVVVLAAEFARSDRKVEGAGDPAGLEATVGELTKTLDAMQAEQAEMQKTLRDLSMRPAAPAASGRMPVGDIDAAVARYIEENRPELVASADPAEEAADPDGIASMDVQTILQFLGDESIDWIEREELWQKLREAGRLDEVLAEFERRAELDPNNPDAQTELGYAYIQKIQEVGAGALAGKWATMADQQFDKALALDEGHWEARYMKAVSLSHWPAFTGKQAEAINQLEKLIEIQGGSAPEDHHAETYLTLGNLYLGQGKTALALETWEKGLAVFPSHSGLLGQVAQAK